MSEHPPVNDETSYWFDKPSSLRMIIIGLVVFCAISFIVPTALDMMASSDPHHGEESHRAFEYESYYGFHAIFGFCAYACIVLGAKVLRKFIMRPEEYYD